jgi:endonuclease YncB( thermonuclease family)
MTRAERRLARGALAVALTLVLAVVAGIVRAQPVDGVTASTLRVLDGDTVRHYGLTYRLLGFDTPEIGRRARCAREDTRGRAAARALGRLVQRARLVVLDRQPCSCAPGVAEGDGRGLKRGMRRADVCNFNRLCAQLLVDGTDVAGAMIRARHARPYLYRWDRPPPPANWCGRAR